MHKHMYTWNVCTYIACIYYVYHAMCHRSSLVRGLLWWNGTLAAECHVLPLSHSVLWTQTHISLPIHIIHLTSCNHFWKNLFSASNLSGLRNTMIHSWESANAHNFACATIGKLLYTHNLLKTRNQPSRQARHSSVISVRSGIVPRISDDPLTDAHTHTEVHYMYMTAYTAYSALRASPSVS